LEKIAWNSATEAVGDGGSHATDADTLAQAKMRYAKRNARGISPLSGGLGAAESIYSEAELRIDIFPDVVASQSDRELH
jgi:hypothetical protein